jgi:hypothetical protein
MRRLPAMIGMLLSCGCSWIFVERAPANHQQMAAFDCTRSVAAPVLDAIWGGLNLVGGLSAARGSDSSWNGPADRGTTMVVGLGWAAMSAASAAYGFVHTNACRQAKDELYARSSPQPAGCEKDIDCKGERICERHQCVFPGVPELAIPAAAVMPSQPRQEVTPASCAPLVRAVAFQGTAVHAGPDRTAPVLFTLATKTAVCAGAAAQGFGFRRVKLVNGTEGFIRISDFSE